MMNNKCWCSRKHRNVDHGSWWISLPIGIRCYGPFYNCSCCSSTELIPIPLTEFYNE